jgi:hypothetical protein
MSTISAFVGHSFLDVDKEVVKTFLDFFDRIKLLLASFGIMPEAAEPKILSQKVREKMEGKNLFIGICTPREYVVGPHAVKKWWFGSNICKIQENGLQWKTSDWILQEIGFAFAKDMKIMLLLEEGMREPGGL